MQTTFLNSFFVIPTVHFVMPWIHFHSRGILRFIFLTIQQFAKNFQLHLSARENRSRQGGGKALPGASVCVKKSRAKARVIKSQTASPWEGFSASLTAEYLIFV